MNISTRLFREFNEIHTHFLVIVAFLSTSYQHFTGFQLLFYFSSSLLLMLPHKLIITIIECVAQCINSPDKFIYITSFLQSIPLSILRYPFIMNNLSMNQNQHQTWQINNENQPIAPQNLKKQHYGFNGRAFPLLGFIVGLGSIIWTYYVARHKSPPDVDPFPKTDITHTAIHYPQYVIFRIGLMVAPVILAITFQLLKNFLEIKSFEIRGHEQKRVNKFGKLSVFSCLLLCVSTATISDGGDMNWTLHTIGATGFFLISLYMARVAAKIYRQLWQFKHFVPEYSYLFKKYTDVVLASFIGLEAIQGLKLIDWGSFVEWAAAFYLMFFFLTLYWDFKDFNLILRRK